MDPAGRAERIADHWRRVCDEVAEAALACGRSADAVRVVAVSKYVDAETTELLRRAGCLDLGESRPQSLVEKAEALAGYRPLHWHLVGSLQRNKARRVVAPAAVIHSIDHLRLLQHLARIADEQGCRVDGLLQVNISGDANKHGFTPHQLLTEADQFHLSGHLRLVGLMGMAGLGTTVAQAQHQFALLRELRDKLAQVGGPMLAELSMGMSDDFPAAIAEGATMVRIGSRLFQGLHD